MKTQPINNTLVIKYPASYVWDEYCILSILINLLIKRWPLKNTIFYLSLL